MTHAQHTSSSYGQYCPLALAAELLCKRWTILVVSRLIDGCSTFNEIHQGVPRISPSLLSTRLKELEHAGVVVKEKRSRNNGYRYRITPAGSELEPIVNSMAMWGQHWARDNDLDDLDLGFLAWSMSLRIDGDKMPPGRTVLEFEFGGAPTDFKRFWLVSNDGTVDMCLKHPGYDTDLVVKADLSVFVETWRGFRDMRAEIRAGRIRLSGSPALKRAFPDWLLLSMFAHVERKANGRERRLSERRRAKTR